MNKFHIVDSEKMSLRLEASLIDFKSKFNFISEHNGFRRGKIHVIMGTSGSGKSTLVRSLLMDLMEQNPHQNVLLFLSEETIQDFKMEIAHSNFCFKNRNIWIISEQEMENVDSSKFFIDLNEFITKNSIDFFLFDNITTSRFYNDIRPAEQGAFIRKLKKLTKEKKIATLLVAHTKADVWDNSPRLINENDIRGSKTIVNLAEFFYIMQRFQINEEYFQTVKIVKHRSQDPNNKLFVAEFDRKKKIYTRDLRINFERFKEIFNDRNKLSSK